ncbi:hypothetical protein N7537_003523 [Penicillium hordei]|uniref:Uncharacterized protein n=1 Tax=Penicillium hordei TaxID=40994 RepID=A0AAD6EA10_9EURO|nr:uncharacterized protein N7537_003523 [Penicillium hordei]KAJ5606904.1 hypothetical protein N7537_003523 [Penicillium hordei]
MAQPHDLIPMQDDIKPNILCSEPTENTTFSHLTPEHYIRASKNGPLASMPTGWSRFQSRSPVR